MFLIGQWDNFQEMENNLSLPELEAILTAIRKKEHAERKFAAALKGINLDEQATEGKDFDEVKREAMAKLAGVSEEAAELYDTGLGYEEE